MLSEIFPRFHARYTSLPLLGVHLDGFIAWLRQKGYSEYPIRMRLQAAKRLDDLLVRQGIRLQALTAARLLTYAPAKARDDVHLSSVIRSLVGYFSEQAILAPTPVTPTDALVARYRAYLKRVRGLSALTIMAHDRTATQFLTSLRYDRVPGQLCNIDGDMVETFLQSQGKRQGRATLQHTIAYLRSFLRFLATSDLAPVGLENRIDTPRLYRGERLPRALPWETGRALLHAIDRSTTKGLRDYAMLLLAATYGLRSSEVVALTLDDVHWRADTLSVRRSKVGSSFVLPLTPEVGEALLDYLRHGRKASPDREIFLRLRAPAGPLKRTAVTDVFQDWVHRSGLPIPYHGAHCLRHTLAVHLLRQGTPLKAIGDLLGHRSTESTCVYLRLHVEDLREVALPLPPEVEAQP